VDGEATEYTTVPAEITQEGQVWQCDAIPLSNGTEGETGSSSVTIQCAPGVWYEDLDEDGWGSDTALTVCEGTPYTSSISGDCDDTTSTIGPDQAETRDLEDNDCDGLIDEGFFAEGDVLITEVMAEPLAVSDGTWVEVHNVSDASIDFAGWSFETELDSHSILSSIVVPPDGRFTIGTNADADSNGGVTIDEEWTDLQIDPANDNLQLLIDGQMIDSVLLDSSVTPQSGVALGFDEDQDQWCNQVTSLAGGDRGTPGQPNDTCIDNHAPVAVTGPDQAGWMGQSVLLDGRDSYDEDGDSLTYSWSLVVPDGSASTLYLTDESLSGFEVDVRNGVYVATLTVDDGWTSSTTDITIIVGKNGAPIAAAGANQSVIVGDTAVLDGSKSHEPDGDPMSALWSFVSLPATSNLTDADIQNASDLTARFEPDVSGVFVVEISVSDGLHLMWDQTQVTAYEVSGNTPPVAVAPVNIHTELGKSVFLNGLQSYDDDGDPLYFSWTIASAPEDTEMTPVDVHDRFLPVAFVQPDTPGEWRFLLTVDDGLDTNVDTLIVTVAPNDEPPTAKAGLDQTVELGDTVTLSGLASSDPEMATLTFDWMLYPPADSAAELDANDSTQPSFVADVPGLYLATLEVSDGYLVDQDLVWITVE